MLKSDLELMALGSRESISLTLQSAYFVVKTIVKMALRATQMNFKRVNIS
jgi:hypothetical protein